MQLVDRYHIKPDKHRDLNKWILAKEKEGIPTAPGWKYLGSFFTSFGFGRYDFEVRWEIPNYAAIDAWREVPDAPWKRVTAEFWKFVDETRPIDTTILREASEPSSMA